VTGTLTDSITGAVEQKFSATWNLLVTADVSQTYLAKYGFQVKGTQDVHVQGKGDSTHEAGLAVTVNGALSKHVANVGYKLEATPDANTHVTANLKIRGDVNAVFSSPDTTVDGDTSILVDAGSTIEAKAPEIPVIGSSLIKLAGPKIDILGGEVMVKGGNITMTAATNLSVKAKAAVVAAAPGTTSINGGPHATFTAGQILLNVMGGTPSGQHGAPGSGSYYDKARKIIVLDPSLQSNPQAAADTLNRLTDRALNPQTPLYGQEKPMSCAIASSRMVIDTQTGRDVGEAALRDQSSAMSQGYDPQNGTYMTSVDDLLRNNGVSGAAEPRALTVDDLATHTANGDPALVQINHYDNAGNVTGGHAIVVDGVTTNPDGTRNILVRDPGPQNVGTVRSIPESDFMNNYYQNTDPNGGRTRYIEYGITTDGSGDTGG
jgi:hypothetical protein